jgi:TRAP-type C4-dicarboxylate transport system permease large subunit
VVEAIGMIVLTVPPFFRSDGVNVDLIWFGVILVVVVSWRSSRRRWA